MNGNYHTPTTPQTGNFRRVTTEAYFTPDGGDGKTGDLWLGRVAMSSLKHNSAETELSVPWKGTLKQADVSVSELKPTVELTLTEYIPNLVPIYLFGDKGPDQVQAAATAATQAFAAVYIGRSYRINKLGLSNFSLKTGATVYQPDVDYQLDIDKGIVTIMDGGAIADNTAVAATFDCAAVTRPSFKPYTRPNRYGFLRYYTEDATSNQPREETYVRVNLIPTDYGDGDPKKYSESKLKCVFLGQPVVYGRY